MLRVANSIQMLCSPAYTCCGAKARMILNYFLPIRYSASRVARAQRAAKQQPYALLLSNADDQSTRPQRQTLHHSFG
jgi:hypothetical protein